MVEKPLLKRRGVEVVVNGVEFLVSVSEKVSEFNGEGSESVLIK